MDVQKECPCSQRHHTRRLDEAATESGVQSVFFSQSHLPQFPETLSAGRFRPSERPFRRKSGSRFRRLSGKRYWFCSCVRLDISTRRGARFPAAPAPVSAARSFHNPIPAQSAETGLPECFLRRPEYGLYRSGSRFPALGYGRTPATRGPAGISTRPFYGYAV